MNIVLFSFGNTNVSVAKVRQRRELFKFLKGRAKNRSILQFCLAFSHQCVYLSSVKRSEAIKCGVIQW